MKKKIIGGGIIAAIAMVITFNLSIVFSTDAGQRLNLENVVAKADWEMHIDQGELRTEYCDDGSYFDYCEETSRENYCYVASDKSCPKQSLYDIQGHNKYVTFCFVYCTRCSYVERLCDD